MSDQNIFWFPRPRSPGQSCASTYVSNSTPCSSWLSRSSQSHHVMLDWRGRDQARDVVGSGTEAVRRNCNSANHSIPPNLAASAVPTASGTCTSWAKWLSLWRPDANVPTADNVQWGRDRRLDRVASPIASQFGQDGVRSDGSKGGTNGPVPHHRRARSPGGASFSQSPHRGWCRGGRTWWCEQPFQSRIQLFGFW